MVAVQAVLHRHARPLLLAAVAAVLWGLWFALFLRTMSPRPLVTLHPEPPTEHLAVEFSGAGDKLVAVPYYPRQIHFVKWPVPSQKGPVEVWSIPSGRLLGRILGPDDGVWWAELSPDGERLAVLQGAPRLTVLEVSTGETFTVDCFKDWATPFDTWPGYCCFSGDGQLLACSAHSRKNGSLVVLWDLERRREVLRLEGHAGPMAFSTDGRLLATCNSRDRASWDNPIAVWDIATGKQGAEFHLRAAYITRIVFSPNGQHLAAGGEAVADSPLGDDIDVAVWHLDTGDQVACMLGLKEIEDLGEELRVSARWVERPLASQPHSRRLPADPYFELLSTFRRSEGGSPRGRWRFKEQHRESWLNDLWEFAGGFLDDGPEQGRCSGQVVVRDSQTDEPVATLQRTGPYRLSRDERRLAMASDNGIEIWDLPPRQPVGLLLAFAAVPALLFTALIWWRLR